MRTALLTGAAAAAFALVATAAARAETVYIADMDTVAAPAPGYVYATDPDYVVQDRSYVVVTPPRQRVIVAPPREVIVDRPAYLAPPAYVAPRSGYYSTEYTTGYGSAGCMIDALGVERCF